MVLIYAKGAANNSLRDYAVRRGWDDGVWAVSEPAALWRAVRAGKVEIVLASNLNGLARSSLELVELLREFVSRKVALIIPSQGIDTSKVPRKAIAGMLDAIEEFKRVAATENTRQGLIRARKRGVRLGRPATLDAYRDDVNRLRAQGRTGRAIAKELGLPNGSVFQILKRQGDTFATPGGRPEPEGSHT